MTRMPSRPSQPSSAPEPSQPSSRPRRVLRTASAAADRAGVITRSLRARSEPAEQSRREQVAALTSSAAAVTTKAVKAAATTARTLPGRAAQMRGAVRIPQPGLATVHGRSMEPTLHEGDRLLVLWGGPIIPGRLAVVRFPDSPGGPRPLSVKRVSGPEADKPGHWWIERDNPREGVDSWQVGGIPASDVAALVVARIPALPALRGSLRGSLQRFTRGRLG